MANDKRKWEILRLADGKFEVRRDSRTLGFVGERKVVTEVDTSHKGYCMDCDEEKTFLGSVEVVTREESWAQDMERLLNAAEDNFRG